jgi:hypothetical protein
MKSRIIGKIVSLVLLSMLIAWASHHRESNNGQMGREAYLAKQAERFDRHYAKPDSFFALAIGCLILAVPTFGLYEGMAWMISRAFKGVDEEAPDNSQG